MTWLHRSIPALVALVAVGLFAISGLWWTRVPPAPGVLAAPNAFSGPVNGGCYLETPVECRIHIDGWQPIVTDQGQRLVGFQLSAQRLGHAGITLLHDFRTDVSNPPAGAYYPSQVRQDYAAACGTTYVLMLSVKDTSDLSFEQVGQTTTFTCPMGAMSTATPTPTATMTPMVTATASSTPSAPDWQAFLPAVLTE